MGDWERDLTEEGSGGVGRRRSLGVLIVAASALVTLLVILWFVTDEFPGFASKYELKIASDGAHSRPRDSYR